MPPLLSILLNVALAWHVASGGFGFVSEQPQGIDDVSMIWRLNFFRHAPTASCACGQGHAGDLCLHSG